MRRSTWRWRRWRFWAELVARLVRASVQPAHLPAASRSASRRRAICSCASPSATRSRAGTSPRRGPRWRSKSRSASWSTSGRRRRRSARCCWWRRFRATTPRCCAIRCARCSPSTTSGSPTGSNARLVPLTAGPFHLADYVDYVRDWITAAFARPARHLGLPADRAGARRGLAAWRREAKRSPATDGHDGRADRRAAQPDRGEQPGAQEAVLVVRAERDPARAGEVSRATCGASTRASCSTWASWR